MSGEGELYKIRTRDRRSQRRVARREKTSSDSWMMRCAIAGTKWVAYTAANGYALAAQ